MDGWAMTTAPIAATSDGETACFIGDDGALWMCTPDTIQNPRRVTDNAFWVQCSADNEFFLMKGDFAEYFSGNFCDLYLIDTEGAINYQYGNVLDVYMTKDNVYIVVGKDSDHIYLEDTICALYCKNESGYKLLYDDFSARSVSMVWWGEKSY